MYQKSKIEIKLCLENNKMGDREYGIYGQEANKQV